jgi:hypothetical protein
MIRILKMVQVNLPISETRLGINGPISNDFSYSEQAYQMVVETYDEDNELKLLSNSPIHFGFHKKMIDKHGIEALQKGVKIESLLDIIGHQHKSIPGDERFKIEVERISESIMDKFERDSFYNDYSPGRFKEFIEQQLLALGDKFTFIAK